MRYLNIMKKALAWILFLSFSATASAGCLTGKISGTPTNWYTPVTLTITNTCNTAQNLSGTVITFNNNGQPVSSVWGDYTASSFNQNGFTLVNSANKPALAANASATLQFGINTGGTPFNMADANNTLAINGSSASNGGSSGSGSGSTDVPPGQVIDTPVPQGCLTASFISLSDANNKWYTGATLKITNSCGKAMNLDNAVVSFTGNATNVDGPWYPFKGTAVSVTGGKTSFTLASQNASQNNLANGATIALPMGIYMNGAAFGLINANATLQIATKDSAGPTPNDGVIKIVVNPAGVSGLTSGAVGKITITSNALAQPIIINNNNWTSTSTYTYSALQYANYSVAVDNVGNYSGNANPVSVSVQNNNAQTVNVTYTAIPVTQKGTVKVTLPVKPLSSLSDSNITVNVTDTNTNQVKSEVVNFNQSASFANLIAGDTYVVSLVPATLSDGVQTATPVFSANNFKLAANATQNVTVNFQVVQNPTTAVTFNVSGLTAQVTKVNLILTNLQGNRIGTLQLGNGTTSMQIPNNTYTVDANATPLVANINPSNFTVPETKSVSITVGEKPVFVPQLGAYWAGWMGYQYDLQGTYGNLPLTHIYLAFANFTNNKLDTSVSGWYGDVPTANSQIQPTYQNWTTYAYNHPNTKIMVSLGGASFGAMWHGLTNDTAANNMATAVINMLKTKYPVYAPAFASPQVAFAINGAAGSAGAQYGQSRLLGYVEMGGVDFDVEVSGAQEMAQLTPYLVKVMSQVHQALPNKAISVAVFSVGGDPQGACTVPGSAHCGEALPLIQAVKANAALKDIVTYNVMAYDAGEDFVLPTANNGGKPLYQKAMQNYVNAVGNPAQVILGLDLQRQWGVTNPETCAQLAAKAQWAYQNPNIAGGTFLWEIGDDSNACKALPALQGMQANMPK